eukprot:TRINITY_DN4199_c0_g1_i2.p1 TRINITY_DN4199_c0_g1~~TRINITY_DN4199_c0_g1_i2.p1  ORF type:complete len:118 (-),score=15.22 TRINITY_DN4199_c0_g1_i2:85-438(-)
MNVILDNMSRQELVIIAKYYSVYSFMSTTNSLRHKIDSYYKNIRKDDQLIEKEKLTPEKMGDDIIAINTQRGLPHNTNTEILNKQYQIWCSLPDNTKRLLFSILCYIYNHRNNSTET